MARGDRVLALLGDDGLRIALLSSFDHAALVRLANSCGASVRGMRNQAVSSDRLARSLVTRSQEDGSARANVLRALTRSNRDFLADYRTWTAESVRARLARLLARPRPDAGRLLFALAREPLDGFAAEEVHAAAEVLGQALAGDEGPRRSVAKKAAKVTSARAEARALRRENAELTRRLGTLEGQLARAQERLEAARKELAEERLELRNLQLSQHRAEAEKTRSEREIRRLSSQIEEGNARRKKERLGEAFATVRDLATQQDKVSRSQEKLLRSETARVQRELGRVREQVRKELAGQTKAARERSDQLAAALVGVRKEFAELREAVESRSPVVRARDSGDAERVGVYVDVQNVYYAAREKSARLDFSKLIEKAAQGRRLVRAAAYLVESKDIDQRAFINLLQSHSYEVKRKPLKVRADGSMKGDWDLEIALDVLADSSALDVVVLVTGDGDFASLVRELKRRGPRVEVYSFRANAAQDLREAADRFVPITRRMLLPLPPSRSGGGSRSRTGGTKKKSKTGGSEA